MTSLTILPTRFFCYYKLGVHSQSQQDRSHRNACSHPNVQIKRSRWRIIKLRYNAWRGSGSGETCVLRVIIHWGCWRLLENEVLADPLDIWKNQKTMKRRSRMQERQNTDWSPLEFIALKLLVRYVESCGALVEGLPRLNFFALGHDRERDAVLELACGGECTA